MCIYTVPINSSLIWIFFLQYLFRLSIGFFSFLWVDNYSKVCGVFKSRCDYLKPRYLTFHERIMDVGFAGQWWVINKKMEEFDINPNEWIPKYEEKLTQ